MCTRVTYTAVQVGGGGGCRYVGGFGWVRVSVQGSTCAQVGVCVCAGLYVCVGGYVCVYRSEGVYVCVCVCAELWSRHGRPA